MKMISILICTFLSFGMVAQEEMFHGGFADGYGKIELDNQLILSTKGGFSDGYFLGHMVDSSVIIGQGGFSDGHATGLLNNSIHLLSRGGIADGYHSDFWIRKYWTGSMSFEWHNGSNWSDGIVPDGEDEIIIPADCLFYPILGDHILHIGESGILTDFNSKSLWLQENASLTGSANAWLENSNLLRVDGDLYWKNVNMKSIWNKPGGKIIIGSSGLMQIEQ